MVDGLMMAFAEVVRGGQMSPAFGTTGHLVLYALFWVVSCAFALGMYDEAYTDVSGLVAVMVAGCGAFLSYAAIGHGLRYTMGREAPKQSQIDRNNEPLLWWLPKHASKRSPWWQDALGMALIGLVRGAFLFLPLAVVYPVFLYMPIAYAAVTVAASEIGWRVFEEYDDANPIRIAEGLRGFGLGVILWLASAYV